MQSIIVLGPQEKVRQKAEEICIESKISKFDKEVITTEKAVGIADIRLLQKKIFLTPVKGDKKAVILEAFFQMTNDSQNAFLKILEEPPESTIIMILVDSVDFLLPTVLSRCKLIDVSETRRLSEKEIEENLSLLEEATNPSSALRIAQDYSKDKETALNFLENLMTSLHQNLSDDKRLGESLRKIQKTYTIIKSTNVNVRFALENLLLNINGRDKINL